MSFRLPPWLYGLRRYRQYRHARRHIPKNVSTRLRFEIEFDHLRRRNDTLAVSINPSGLDPDELARRMGWGIN